MIFRILPVIISCLLLGAHFLRAGNIPLTVGCVLMPLLLLINAWWSVMIVQLLTYIGVLIWVKTAIQIYHRRLIFGMPWVRAVVIVGAVALFTAFAGLLLNSSGVKKKYPPALFK
jgi:hypothetical protein